MKNVFNALKDGTLARIKYVPPLVTYATPGMRRGNVNLVIEDTLLRKGNVLGIPINLFLV